MVIRVNKLFIFLFLGLFLLSLSGSLIPLASAENETIGITKVYYFYGDGCPHCAEVAQSGILEKVDAIENIEVEKFEIYHNDDNRDLFVQYAEQFGLKSSERGVPFAVIDCGVKFSYVLGSPIIDNLENKIQVCSENGQTGPVSPVDPNAHKITLGSLIIAALVDSVNPCAFGVLIFLMISLLKMGSSKRALRAGLIYTLVVFIVYFLSGLGIFKVIQSFTSITHYIYLGAGVLVLFVGLWQFKDVFLPRFGPSLQISSRAKPTIERIIQNGTIPAMILLGIVVSLFELPCTGGIYIGILTMMSINKTFGIGYLLLYNLIFVLPLIVLTLLIYNGTSPEMLQKWTSSEKKWMKIASGIVLIGLGLFILFF